MIKVVVESTPASSVFGGNQSILCVQKMGVLGAWEFQKSESKHTFLKKIRDWHKKVELKRKRQWKRGE